MKIKAGVQGFVKLYAMYAHKHRLLHVWSKWS